MRRTLVFVLIAASLSGCAARTQVSASSNTGGGATTTSGGLRVEGGSNSFAVAIIAISLIAGAIEYARGEPRPMPSPADLFPGEPRAPQLAPDRRIVEQDCRQPIDHSAGNLRCK